MSGPKCGEYHVVSESELARRRLVAARDRLQRLRERIGTARVGLETARAAYDIEIADVDDSDPVSDDPAVWEGRIERCEQWLEQVDEAVASALVVARRQAVRARVASLMSAEGTATFGHAELDPASDERRSDAAESIRRAVERASALLDKLPGDVSDADHEHCADLFDAVADAASGLDATAALELLRIEVERAVTSSTRRRDRVAQLEELMAGLDGLDGIEVERMRGRLRALDPAADLPAGLAQDVEAVREEAERARDAAFVLAQASDALSELGYEVGEQFATEASEGGGSVLALPGASRHAVRIRQVARQLRFDVVRLDPAGNRDAAEDTAAEETFCEDFAELREALGEAGVAMDLTMALAPGQRPVDVLRREPATVARPRRARRTRRRSRS